MAKRNVIKKSGLAPTALIAGGAGFIGSHLAETLLQKEARVVVLDNFHAGTPTYMDHLLKNPKFALFNIDINQGLPPEIESVDYIFHLASLETYKKERNADLDALLTNAVGTKNLLDLAEKSQAKFLLASSIDVYQGQISPIELAKYFGQTEEEAQKYELVEAKRFAEAMVWEFYKKHDTDVRIVRLPEVYGPRMNLESSGVLGTLIQELLEGNNLTIRGDGVEKEYYLYISDAISGLVKALFQGRTKGKIYTLVEEEPYSILEVTFLLRNLANKEIAIQYAHGGNDRVRESKVPDTSTTKQLRWQPKVTLKEGLAETLTSLGYSTNEHSFKPYKIIEAKVAEKSATPKEGLLSLQALKGPEIIPTQAERQSFGKLRARLSDLKKKFKSNVQKPTVYKKEPPNQKFTLPKLPLKRPGVFAATFIFSFLLIFVGLPTLQTYVHAKSAVSHLKKIPHTLAQLQTEEAKNSANTAFQKFYKAQNSLERLNWVFKLLGKRDDFNSTLRLFKSAAYFSESAYNTSKALAPFDSIWEIIKPESPEELSTEQLSQTKRDLEKANTAMKFAQVEFKYINEQALPKAFKNLIQTYGSSIDLTAESLAAAITTAADLPNLLGTETPQKYLILFQNSNELRPTGGFIGSYAILELNKGKVNNLTIDDIYNPDGQIDVRNISVAAPHPIQTFLKEPQLHIRNANWNPDFTKSAQTIEDLFFRIDGERFGGVIAIDLNFTQKLLEITGPVFLTAYNEEVTAQNLYEKAQFYSEFNYEEGVSQKRSFLTLLSSKLLEKVFALPRDKMPELLTALQTLLAERHLLVYLGNSPTSVMINKQGWDGSLTQTNKDYLYVVNANLGGTKANYFVKNRLNYKITTDTRDGLLRATLTLTYDHTGQDSTWPGGPYTDYVRVLTQKGSKLTGANLTQMGVTKDIFKEIVLSEEGNYDTFETSFVLQPQQTAVVTLAYDLPQNLSLTKDNADYELYWQKQPGTQNDQITFEFDPPFGMSIAETNLSIDGSTGNAVLTDTLNTDKSLYLKLD